VKPVFRIHLFLGLMDPDPDPLVRGVDPYPDPSIIKQKNFEPYVFGPPSSGSIRHRNESGSGSFYHQAKLGRKTLISTVLRLRCTFYL
jgi:hypothetical protein